MGVQVEDEEDLRQKVEEVWRDVKYLLVGLSFWAEDKREAVWRGEVSVRCLPRVPLGREKDVDVDAEGKVVVSEFVRLRRGYMPGMCPQTVLKIDLNSPESRTRANTHSQVFLP